MRSKRAKEARRLAKAIRRHNPLIREQYTDKEVYEQLKKNYKEAKKNGAT